MNVASVNGMGDDCVGLCCVDALIVKRAVGGVLMAILALVWVKACLEAKRWSRSQHFLLKCVESRARLTGPLKKGTRMYLWPLPFPERGVSLNGRSKKTKDQPLHFTTLS